MKPERQKALFDNRKTDKAGQRTMFDDVWQASEAVERSKLPKKRSMLDFPETDHNSNQEQ